MLNYYEGIPIATVMGGANTRVVFVSEEPNPEIQNFEKLTLTGNEYFQPIGNKNSMRALCWALLGANEVGKSYQIARMLNSYYLKAYPKHKIYLFSEKAEDKELDKIKRIKRIELNDELLDDPITLENLHEVSKDNGGVLCIFDDVDSLHKQLKSYIYSLIRKIFNVGRSYKINIIVTNHAITNGNETKSMLNECKMISTFPKAGWTVQQKRFWEEYCGLSKNEVKLLRSNTGRMATYVRTIPNVVIQEKCCFVLGN